MSRTVPALLTAVALATILVISMSSLTARAGQPDASPVDQGRLDAARARLEGGGEEQPAAGNKRKKPRRRAAAK